MVKFQKETYINPMKCINLSLFDFNLNQIQNFYFFFANELQILGQSSLKKRN